MRLSLHPTSREKPRAAKRMMKNGLSLLRRFSKDESGSYIVIAAFAMPLLIGASGLATEAGLWLYTQQSMQGAADAGAMSAATAYSVGIRSNLSTQADAVTASYGFVDGVNGATITVNQPPLSGTHKSTPGAIEVIVRRPQVRLLTSMWSTKPVPISARAVAVGNGAFGCVLALDPTASSATSVQGTSTIALNGCSLYDDSSNGNALSIGGSGSVSALSVGVVGGISGGSAIHTTQGTVAGYPNVPDPYASDSFPSFSGCAQTNFSAKTTITISQGVYCGGMTLNAGANVTLNPGVYYINNGSLSINGGATMSGSGVTLVFTSSNGSSYGGATINGGAVVNLTPPPTGSTAGIVIFGDRNMPVGTSFKFNGGAAQVFGGAIYLPKGHIDYSGGAGGSTNCTQIIGDTISFTGNSNLAVNCSAFATKPIGSQAATLVE